MKKLFKLMTLGMLTLAFAAISTSAIFAQDQTEKRALYDKFTECYKKTNDRVSMQCALDSAKEYSSKYTAPEDKPQTDYFQQTAIPFIEKQIAALDKAKSDAEAEKKKQELYGRFNTAAETKNLANLSSSGSEILSAEPDFLDVNIVLALVNYDKSVANDASANADAIKYAQKSISLIESGTTSKSYGAKSYNLNSTTDAKSNSLGWLNYNIGYVMFYGQKKKKEALPYLYKATQYKSGIQQASDPYQAIGEYYYDEVARIDKERKAIIEGNNNEDNEQSLALLATENGNSERALDAYARAYKFAQANKDVKPTYTTGLYTRLKALYSFRFNKEDGLDAYITSTTAKTQPDPTTEVKPVMDEKKDPTTPGTTDSSTTKPPTTTTTKPMTAKPPTTTTTKPATTDKPPTKPATDKPATDKPMTKPPTAPKKSGTTSSKTPTAKTKTQKTSPR